MGEWDAVVEGVALGEGVPEGDGVCENDGEGVTGVQPAREGDVFAGCVTRSELS